MGIAKVMGGSLFLIFAIWCATSMPDVTVKCVVAGVFGALGIALVASGFRGK